ncbi:MAG TPA: tetratricopeptide repeat protein [Thermoanaerobaculia bacterium]
MAAIVLIVAAYANSLDNSFHFDDSHVIESNLYLRSLDHVPRFFTDANTFSSLPQNATYRPLVTLSLALDYAWGEGLAPRAFHVTQIALLLILGVMLVAFFVPVMARGNDGTHGTDGTSAKWLALFAATLFCVHTANTETLNLISARSELLSTIGLLGSFLLYQRSPFARRTFLYLIPLAIGALAKAPLVVFAPLLFFYALYIERETPKRAFRIALPPLILGIALLLFLNSMNSPHWTSGGGNAWQYVITQPFVWLHYARLFFLPIGLTADTDLQPFVHWYDTRAIAGYAFIALLVFAIRRASKPVAFGLLWSVIALIPTSIFPLAEVSNEHRIFFAYIGAVLAFALFATRYARRGTAIAAVALLLVHAAGTYERNKTWASEETLWTDVVAKSPGNGRAWMNYGLTQMAKGELTAAKSSFDRAATFVPNYSTLEINQGIVTGLLGDQAMAERHFRRALQLSADANSNYYFARWLVDRGRASEALPLLRESVRLSPANPAPRALLMRLLAALGEEHTLLDETRRLDPNDPTVVALSRTWPEYQPAFDAGLAAIGQRDWLTAAHACRAALRHDPRSADAWNNLGWSLAQLGFRQEAVRAYEQALAIAPMHERARNNLVGLRAQGAGPR